jgi:PAS domain S-box-containing protein
MSRKEKTKTSGFKLGFLVNLTILLLFTSLGFGLYIYFMKELESQKLQESKLRSDILSEDIIKGHLLPTDSTKTPGGLFRTYVESYNIAYCVLTKDSSQILNSFNFREAENNDYLSSAGSGDYIYETTMYKIKSTVFVSGINYTLYLGLNGQFIENFIQEKNKIVIPFVGGLMLFGYLILLLLSKIYITRPINKIAFFAQGISAGNYDLRARYTSSNELGIIASSINYLVHHLDKSNTQVSMLNKEIKTVVKDKLGELNLEVNQRRLAEHKLRQSEEQFRLLFERAPIGMVITTIEGKIIRSNSAFCETLGYAADEIEDKNIADLTAEEYIEYDRKLHKALLTGNLSHVYFEKELRKKDGFSIHAIVESVLTRDESNHPHHIIQQVIDITERKKVERELIISKEKAEESDRLKSAFLAQMSHEIRTPLNVILTATPLLADDLSNEDEDINVLLESVNSAGKRLQRTIDMILNLSSVQSGNYISQFEVVDLSEDLKILVDEMKSLASEKNLILSFTNLAYDPLIKADKYTLNQIFQNLIGNAIKYTQTGTIEVQVLEEKPGKINVEVKDTGIGMSSEYLKKLFTPFSQEDMGYKREFEGNGLGLALVKKYVELNNADIFVKSEKKKGTTFKVVFNKSADKKAYNSLLENKVTKAS